MNTYITTLFNKGINDGDLDVKTSDGLIKCHQFIIRFLTNYSFDNIQGNLMDLSEYSTVIVCYVIDYLYSQSLTTLDLTCDDIVSIFKLIDKLQCKEFIKEMKEKLSKQFLNMINIKNWVKYYDMFNTNHVFNELNELLLQFYSNNILTSVYDENDINEFLGSIKNIKSEKIYDLLLNALSVHFIRNKKAVEDAILVAENNSDNKKNIDNQYENDNNNDIDIYSENDDNNDNDNDNHNSDNENEDNKSNNDDNENDDENDDEKSGYSIESIVESLKKGLSFKQISDTFSKKRDIVINDFVLYLNKNEKGRKLDTLLKKYNINNRTDRLGIEKLKNHKAKN